MYKYILLDIDGTLLDFERCAHDAFMKTAEHFNLGLKDEVYPIYSACNDKYWKMFEKNEISLENLKTKRFDELFANLGIGGITGEEFNPIYGHNLSTFYYKMEGADGILEYLKGRYTLYALTNGIAKTQHKRLSLSGIDKYFEKIFISEEIGASKPSKEYFERSLAIAGIKEKSECIMIGDSITSDMLGAHNAGIDKIWFNPEHRENGKNIKIEFEIEKLSEIKNIL